MAELSLTDNFFGLLNSQDIDELAEKLEPAGITVNRYDDGRIHFEVNLFDSSYKPYDVRYDAKGIVVDGIDKTFLAVPNRSFKYINMVKESDVVALFDKGLYNIIEAYDGTNITFYNFNGELYAATAKSVDVSNFYWQGSKTFAEMFFEVATSTNPDFVKAVALKLTSNGNLQWNIPETFSVTLGFRHHNIHPDTSDPQAIWFTRCVNRVTLLDEELPQLAALKRNKVVTDQFASYKELTQKADRDITLNHNDKLYGYILDSKNLLQTKGLSHIFIPSSLYKLYQHFFYAVERCKDDEISHSNRYLYSIFRNVLANNTNYLKVLIRLMPKYSDDIDKINIFIDSMINRILARALDSTVLEGTQYIEYVDEVIENIKKNEPDLDIKSMEANKLVNDVIRSVDNAYKLTELYLKER